MTRRQRCARTRPGVHGLQNGVPHSPPATVHVPIRPSDDLRIRPKLEAIQHVGARVGHRPLSFPDRIGDPTRGGFYQDRIMHRSTDGDAVLSRSNTRQSKHFSAVRL